MGGEQKWVKTGGKLHFTAARGKYTSTYQLFTGLAAEGSV
jgi:hypothetical protein